MKRLLSIDKFETRKALDDGTFIVHSGKDFYTVNLGSEDVLPSCSCADFCKNISIMQAFFAVFKVTEKSWSDISSKYIKSPYMRLDLDCLKSAHLGYVTGADLANLQPESPIKSG